MNPERPKLELNRKLKSFLTSEFEVSKAFCSFSNFKVKDIWPMECSNTESDDAVSSCLQIRAGCSLAYDSWMSGNRNEFGMILLMLTIRTCFTHLLAENAYM